MWNDQVAEARERREASSVLFTRLLDIRNDHPDLPIAAIEGSDDIGVWSIWFDRANFRDAFELLPCKGKKRVFELREIVSRSKRITSDKIVFIVDRDYDELAENSPSPNTFMTDMYAIENYFLRPRVIMQILDACFACAGDRNQKLRILDLFRSAFSSYQDASVTTHVNTFIFRKLRINAGISLPDKLKDILNIDEDFKFSALSEADVKIKIPNTADMAEVKRLEDEFFSLSFEERGRGKYHKLFLLHFFQSLQKERDQDNRVIFTAEKAKADFKFSGIALYEHAALSYLPAGLEDFLLQNFSRQS